MGKKGHAAAKPRPPTKALQTHGWDPGRPELRAPRRTPRERRAPGSGGLGWESGGRGAEPALNLRSQGQTVSQEHPEETRRGAAARAGWWGRAPQYLAVHTHPATVQRVLTQARGAAQLVLPCGGVDDLDGRVAHRPVDTEVGGLPRLPRLRVADA